MGEEDKKKERGVADIVPVRADGTKPREQQKLDLPMPKQNAAPIEPVRKKNTERV